MEAGPSTLRELMRSQRACSFASRPCAENRGDCLSPGVNGASERRHQAQTPENKWAFPCTTTFHSG